MSLAAKNHADRCHGCLRSQFTNSSNPSVDQTELTSARFRQEERLRADVKESDLDYGNGRASYCDAETLATDLAVQHELTLDALEKEMRESMESELAELKKSSCKRKAAL